MTAIPMDHDLTKRLSTFLDQLAHASLTTGIVITFTTGQEYLETDQGDTLPVRINRTNGSYVVEEPYT